MPTWFTWFTWFTGQVQSRLAQPAPDAIRPHKRGLRGSTIHFRRQVSAATPTWAVHHMKLNMIPIGIGIAALVMLGWIFFFFGGVPAITRVITSSSATASAPPEPAPEPPKPKANPVKRAPVEAKQLEAKALEAKPPEATPNPPAEAPPIVAAAPPAPDLPTPSVDDVSIGSSRRDLLSQFRPPAVRTSAVVGGQLLETYIYSPEKSSRDTWVLVREGRVTAKFDVDRPAPPAPVRP